MVVICCSLKRENHKVVKIYLKNSSYIQRSTSLFQELPSTKASHDNHQTEIRFKGAF